MNYIDELAHAIFRIADPGARLSDGELPLYRHYAVLALAKGTCTTRKDVHDAWSAYTAALRPDHPSLVPFANLSPAVQALDQEYVDAIHAVVREREAGA